MFKPGLQTPMKSSAVKSAAWQLRILAIVAVLILMALACQNPLESTQAKETRVAEAVQLTLLSDKLETVEAQQTDLAAKGTSVSPTEAPKDATEAVSTSEPTADQQPAATETPAPVETATPTESLALGIGSVLQWPQDDMTTVFVPAGEFTMGTGHNVTLDAFWIDQTEISNGMYEKCVQAGACDVPAKKITAERKAYYDEPEYNNFPLIYVVWDNAKAYCEWAGRRLPTEAEWEKAARGTDGRIYPWGEDDPTCSLAHSWGFDYYDSWNVNVGKPIGCSNMPTEVDSMQAGASPYGALNMVGNVGEWVADWYGSGYYDNPPESNPTGPSTGTSRVVRGSLGTYMTTDYLWLIYQNHRYNYGDFRFDLRATVRTYFKPSYNFHDLGFRCAANP